MQEANRILQSEQEHDDTARDRARGISHVLRPVIRAPGKEVHFCVHGSAISAWNCLVLITSSAWAISESKYSKSPIITDKIQALILKMLHECDRTIAM